jgi:hypothetical protein
MCLVEAQKENLMHRLTLTLTAPIDLALEDALEAFAVQLQDVADDLAALPPQNHAFGAFGALGCKVYYRVELDEPATRKLAAAGL